MFKLMSEAFIICRWSAKVQLTPLRNTRFFRKLKVCLSCLGMFVGLSAASGCQASPEMVSTPVTGFNHTSANINSFTINGSGGPNIGPYEGGGKQVCCSVIPRDWNPNLKAVIEWEKDPNNDKSIDWPPLGTDAYREVYKRYSAKYTQHRVVVDIPRYAEKVCALQVHFLPCDQVRVSTTCMTPSNPNYPDKAYFQMKETVTCPNL